MKFSFRLSVGLALKAFAMGALAKVPQDLGPVPDLKIGNITTQDGVQLRYTQAGPLTGQSLLFIPGWRQTAAQWNKQIEYFSNAGYHVTTYDMRGHGDSAKPDFGYRLSRFGSDLNDVLTGLGLCDVSVIAHSMGSSVTWAFWDQYPDQRHRVARFVIDDQSSVLVQDPTWDQAERDTWSAALFTPAQTYTFAANMCWCRLSRACSRRASRSRISTGSLRRTRR